MKRIATLLCLCACLCCIACASKQNMHVIPDYDSIMSDIGQQKPEDPDENPPVPIERPTAPTFPGFRTIGFLYKQATDFFGEYTWAKDDDGEYLLHRSGQEYDWHGGKQIFYQDKYIVNLDGVLQLHDVRKGIVLQGNYDEIRYEGNIALATLGSRTYIFKDGVEVGHAVNIKLEILADDLMRGDDGILYDLYLRPQMLGEYFFADCERDGVRIIRDTLGQYGYYDCEKQAVICKPQFFAVTPFVNGYATAQRQVDNVTQSYIIDRQGNFLAQTALKPHAFYDGYIFFEQQAGDKPFLLYDATMQPVMLPPGLIPHGSRVYNGFIIDLACNQIYSIQDQTYLPISFIGIQPLPNGCFLFTNALGTAVYSETFSQLLPPQPHVTFSNGVFRISADSFVYFLERLLSGRAQ